MLKFYQVVLAIILLLAFISVMTDCTGSNNTFLILSNLSKYFSSSSKI